MCVVCEPHCDSCLCQKHIFSGSVSLLFVYLLFWSCVECTRYPFMCAGWNGKRQRCVVLLCHTRFHSSIVRDVLLSFEQKSGNIRRAFSNRRYKYWGCEHWTWTQNDRYIPFNVNAWRREKKTNENVILCLNLRFCIIHWINFRTELRAASRSEDQMHTENIKSLPIAVFHQLDPFSIGKWNGFRHSLLDAQLNWKSPSILIVIYFWLLHNSPIIIFYGDCLLAKCTRQIALNSQMNTKTFPLIIDAAS